MSTPSVLQQRPAPVRRAVVAAWLLLGVLAVRVWLRVTMVSLFITDADTGLIRPGAARVDLLLLLGAAALLVPGILGLLNRRGLARLGLVGLAAAGLVLVVVELATSLPGAAAMPTLLTLLAGGCCVVLVTQLLTSPARCWAP